MKVYEYIRRRALEPFARDHNLTVSYDDAYEMEQKDMARGFEVKVRRVRTPAGKKRYGQPIGSIITNKGRKLKNLTIKDSVFKGFDLVSGKNGMDYDVPVKKKGSDGGKGSWRAYEHKKHDKPVVTADSEEELFDKLNTLAGKKAKKPKQEEAPEEPEAPEEDAEQTPEGEGDAEAEESSSKRQKRSGSHARYGVAPPEVSNYDVDRIQSDVESIVESIDRVEGRDLGDEESVKALDYEWLNTYLERLESILDADEPWEVEEAYESLNERVLESKLKHLKPSMGFSKKADGATFDYPESPSDDDLDSLHNSMVEKYPLSRSSDNDKVAAAYDELYDYVDYSYDVINRYLRTGVGSEDGDDDEDNVEEWKSSINKMEDALWSFETDSDMYSSRHMPANLLEGAQIGDTLTDPAFVSTSLRTDWAYKEQMRRAHGVSGNDTLGTGRVSAMHVKIPKGSPGAYLDAIDTGYGYDPEEAQWEFLLPPGTSFKIVGITETPDGLVYEVEAIFERREAKS